MPEGSTTGSTTAWRLTGRADSKNRCEKMDAPVEILHQEPGYPPEVRQQGMAGSVVIQATVSDDGVPARLKVVRSPDDRLSALAIEALRAWRYKPASCDGMPIETYVTATFSFKLR